MRRTVSEADLAYYTNGRADQEQNDPSARPGISGGVENMDEYNTIILGYPIWLAYHNLIQCKIAECLKISPNANIQ